MSDELSSRLRKKTHQADNELQAEQSTQDASADLDERSTAAARRFRAIALETLAALKSFGGDEPYDHDGPDEVACEWYARTVAGELTVRVQFIPQVGTVSCQVVLFRGRQGELQNLKADVTSFAVNDTEGARQWIQEAILECGKEIHKIIARN